MALPRKMVNPPHGPVTVLPPCCMTVKVKVAILSDMCPRITLILSALMATCCAASSAQAQESTFVYAADSNPALKLRLEAIAYEHGEGVPRNPVLAANIYCMSARLGDAQAQYNLGWMYANGRGVERSDPVAAFFFNAAAEQGLEAAQRMLKVVGAVADEEPDCMRELEAPPADLFVAEGAPPSVDFRLIAPQKIFDLVMKMAPQFKVEPQLALAIISAESNFNSLALSPKNAQGLMQLIPQTSERFNVKNPFDPAQNIRGGLTYLRWLLAYFEGDVALVAAAYNAGEGKVERYRGVPPYQETRAYVQRIVKSVGVAVHPFDETAARPSYSMPLIRLARRGK